MGWFGFGVSKSSAMFLGDSLYVPAARIPMGLSFFCIFAGSIEWLMFMVNVGKNIQYMDPMGGKWHVFSYIYTSEN